MIFFVHFDLNHPFTLPYYTYNVIFINIIVKGLNLIPTIAAGDPSATRQTKIPSSIDLSLSPNFPFRSWQIVTIRRPFFISDRRTPKLFVPETGAASATCRLWFGMATVRLLF